MNSDMHTPEALPDGTDGLVDAPSTYVPTKEAIETYVRYQSQLVADRQKSLERTDNAILTLSAGGLGLSLTFMRDLVKPGQIIFAPALYASWGLFTLAIVITIVSLLLSRRALDRQLELADEYYLQGNEQARSKGTGLVWCINTLDWAAAGSFILAVTCTVAFAIANLSHTRATLDNSGMESRPQVPDRNSKEGTEPSRTRGNPPMRMPPRPPTPKAEPPKPSEPVKK